jgi:hypothetical protein
MRKSLTIAWCVLLVGCGGGGNMNNPVPDMTMLPDLAPAGPASPSDFQNGLQVAYCDNSVLCGFVSAAQKAACEQAVPGNLMMYPASYDYGAAVTGGRLKYDPVAAQACIDAWKKAGCSSDQQNVAAAACRNVYTPLVSVGGTCFAYAECIGGYCKNSQQQGCMGICTAWLAKGDTCDPNNDICDPKVGYCDGTSTKCIEYTHVGGNCDNTTCDAMTFCLADPTPGDAGMGDGAATPPATCRAPGKVGDICQVFFYGDDTCSPELFCDDTVTPNVCATQHDSGAACGSFAACKDGLDCVGLGFDQMTGMTILGKCGPYLDIGATCDPSVSESGCAFDTTCDMTAKKCALRGLPASDCSADFYCVTEYYCDVMNKCSKTVPFGMACTPPADPQNDPDPCNQGTCDATAKKCILVCM